MLKRIIFGLSFAVLATGCDSGSETKQEASRDPQATQVTSETAIYLPGGAGIDFGKFPLHAGLKEEPDGRKYRIITYELKDSVAAIDGALDGVLVPLNYKKNERPSQQGYELSASYRKLPEMPVLVRYKETIKEGSVSVLLDLTWYEK